MCTGSATKLGHVSCNRPAQFPAERGRGVDNARVAGSMNTLRRMSSWNLLLAFALGTSLAVAQEGQSVPETQASKPAPAPAAPAAAGAGVAQAEESPWGKLCTKNEQTGNKESCLILHGGLDAKTGIVLGTVTVRSVEGEAESLLVEVTTDYSLVMPVGVQIKIDDGKPILLQYAFCFATSCQARTELTKEIFDRMRKGQQMIVAAMNMQQKTIGFLVPLTEFGKAYDGPPADNAKYEEAWGQLMERSSQRKIELANKIAEQQKEQGTQQPQAGAPPQAGAQVPAQPPP
jgi:invasion protein IalB